MGADSQLETHRNVDVEIAEIGTINPAQLDAWLRLFNSELDSRFYHHPDWYRCVARFLSGAKLHLIFVSIEGELQMVLPLCDSTSRNRLSHPAHDHLSLNDILIRSSLKNQPDKLVDAIHGSLNQHGSQWWDWQISNVPHKSSLIQSLAQIDKRLQHNDTPIALSSLSVKGDQHNGRWFLKQSRYSAGFSGLSEVCPPQGKLRRNLRRLKKQLEEQGDVRMEMVTKPDALLSAYEQFLSVEASGWKGTDRNATAIKTDPALNAFYEALLTPASAGMTPQINLLWIDDKCIAAQFGILTNDCLSLLKIGYNEEYARFSPGYLLLEGVLAHCCAENVDTLSLVTSPPWAERWHPDKVPVWHIHYYNQSSMGIVLHQFTRFKQAAKARIKQAA